jgi:hypothetical protein
MKTINVVRPKIHVYSANPDYISSLRDFEKAWVTLYFYQYLIPNGIVPLGSRKAGVAKQLHI